jgi:hypothetical protein
LSQVEKQREKRNELIFKAEAIKSSHQEELQKIRQQEDQVSQQEKNLEKEDLELKQLALLVERVSASMKENYE